MEDLNCCNIECDGDAEIRLTEDGENGVYYAVGKYEHYGGPYEVTPSGEAQTLNVEGLACERNIIIGPIPQNYGLVTYNGYSIKIS